ncbi:MAG TPA: glutamate-5-semialdehyde dehydrogenase [Tepidisphaeraceae bacterium]|jgi:glutamate-5-semialdehyde dehydrogenase|nr:glutamate-5-semialdehyde dehydrogenase [Tepidisphaeraceae bacterium]
MEDFGEYVLNLGKAARKASAQLASLRDDVKTSALRKMAAALRAGRETLLAANAEDVAAAQKAEVQPALIERLKLNDKRLAGMADGVEQIAAQVDPVGQIIEGYVRPNGLRICKMRVPLGVVLFFYESRPNVTSDAAALCIKSGNAIILRGGKESIHSNLAIGKIISDSLAASGIDPAAVQLIQSTDRALVAPLLKLDRYIDLVIPRGGESLIRAVVGESTIPVLKHFTGNCHIYVHGDAGDLEEQVRKICVNAKTSYPGGAVCNAVEKILFHKDVAAKLLPKVCQDLAAKGVEIRGDERTRALYPNAKPATESDWPLEYLSLIVAMKVVDSLDAAIAHINEYGSHHTDAIVSNSKPAIEQFVKQVDSASILVNASTRFADGGEYGLGAEIGISTDKLHARGPMGAADLTTYKWIVTGDGHVR